MMITFSHYWPFLLLVLIPVLLRIRQRSASGLDPRLLRRALACRISALALAALALTEPIRHGSSSAVNVAYLLDVSSSVSPSAVQSSIDWIARSASSSAADRSIFIAFGANPILRRDADELRSSPVSDADLAGAVNRSATNLESALDLALDRLPQDAVPRVMLLTDGVANRGDCAGALMRAQERGAQVYTRALDSRPGHDLWVGSLATPDRLSAGSPFQAVVEVFCRADQAAEARIELFQGDQELQSRPVSLRPGLNRVPVDLRLEDEGLVQLRARIEASGDTFEGNDVASQAVWVQRRPRVLYVEGYSPSARYLRNALEEKGFEITVAAPEALARRPQDLNRFEAVVLSDVMARRLPAQAMQALNLYVLEGGGLLFAGGEEVYGQEGYADSPLEKALPVRFRIREKRRDLALMLTLDKSHSMVGPKIELAKEAAKAALGLLDDEQQFGLVAFDYDPYEIVPLQAAEDKEAIGRRISRLQASAHTNIYPALELSLRRLEPIEADIKHVILLSDGQTYPDEYEKLLQRMSEAGISVSTVAVGAEADRNLLADIARWGGGRSYFVADAARVPQVFIQETRMAVQSTIEEEPFQAFAVGQPSALKGIDFEQAPPLRGRISVQAKDDGQILLQTPQEEPVLVRWQHGLGRAAVFASDVKNRWASQWLEWDGYGQLFAQLLRDLLRRQPAEEFDFRAHWEPGWASAELEAVGPDGRFRDDLSPQLEVVTESDGASTLLTMPQIGPGTYGVGFPAPLALDSALNLRLVGEGLPAISRRLERPFPEEYRFQPPDTSLLQSISSQTGGVFDPQPQQVHSPSSSSVPTRQDLWPWLAGLALLCYFVDLSLRRAPHFWLFREHRGAA